MAKDFFGQKVIVSENGKTRLKWATLMTGFIAGPLYALSTQVVANIRMTFDGLRAGATGVLGFVSDFIAGVFAGPRYVIQTSWSSFIRELAQFGAFAYIVGVVGGLLAMYLILKGVTAING